MRRAGVRISSAARRNDARIAAMRKNSNVVARGSTLTGCRLAVETPASVATREASRQITEESGERNSSSDALNGMSCRIAVNRSSAPPQLQMRHGRVGCRSESRSRIA